VITLFNSGKRIAVSSPSIRPVMASKDFFFPPPSERSRPMAKVAAATLEILPTPNSHHLALRLFEIPPRARGQGFTRPSSKGVDKDLLHPCCSCRQQKGGQMRLLGVNNASIGDQAQQVQGDVLFRRRAFKRLHDLGWPEKSRPDRIKSSNPRDVHVHQRGPSDVQVTHFLLPIWPSGALRSEPKQEQTMRIFRQSLS